MVRISKNFIRSSFIYTVAGTLPVASALILLPFYTNYLTTSVFGALSIYLSFSLLIQYITTYSFDISLYIHFHEYKNEPKKLADFVSSAFLLMGMIGLSVGAILTVTGDFVFRHIFTEQAISFYPYGLLACATGIVQALFKVHSNLVQSREKPELFFWSNIIFFLLIVVFTMLGLWTYPQTLIGPIGGRFVAAFIFGTWALFRIFREFGIHFNYPLLRKSFSFNLYTFIYQMLLWVINYFDRILMVFFLTLSTVGVYDFAMKCLLVIEFILNGLHNSFYPKVVSTIMGQKEKHSTPEVNRYYHGFISVIMLLVCVCILTFPWAIETFVRKPEYYQSIQYLPYIAVIYIFRAIRLYFAVPYGILKHSKPLPVIYLVISAIKIGVVLLIVKEYGIAGVILASLLSSIVEIILLRMVIKNRFRFQYNSFKIVYAPVFLFLVIILLEPMYGTTFPLTVHSGYLVLCVGMLWWIYRNEVKMIDPFKLIRK